jgi:glycine hydroxymethyltransferase
VGSRGLTGQQAEEVLQAVGIYVNRNLIPFDPRPPLVTSGIRVGTPAVTFRGLGPAEMDEVADLMLSVVERSEDKALREEVRAQVQSLCRRFPLYGGGPGGLAARTVGGSQAEAAE